MKFEYVVSGLTMGIDDLYYNEEVAKPYINHMNQKIIELDINNTANIGRNDNINHNLTNFGKAGAKRWLGIRPTVKGNVMNAVDHPHGGNTKGGNATPRTKWGKKAKWIKTKTH